MEIKILCECGAKFKFDVEPINGRSPGPVQCPSCGKDQTGATDLKIAEQLAPAAPATSAAPAAPPAGGPKRISILAAMPGAAPAPAPVPTAPAPAPAAASVVKVSAPAPTQVSPKLAVMEVPTTVKALSVKAPGEHVEEAPAAPAAPAPSSEPRAAGSPKMAYMPVPEATKTLSVKPPGEHVDEPAPAAPASQSSEPRAAGSPKMAYMPVPEATKALSVKPPGEHVEEQAPAQIASNSPAPGSPKMAKMEVPTGGTSLSVAGHGKKEEAPAAEPIRVGGAAVSAPAAAPAHPATARMAAPPREIPKSSGVGMGIFGAVVGAVIGAIIWYFIAMNSVALTLLMVIPGVAAGFMARLFARRSNQSVAVGAGVIVAIVVALTEMAVLSGLKEKYIAEDLAMLYEERMALARQATEARSDQQVREVMLEDPETTFSTPDTISDEAVAKYRRNELAALVKFAKGEPTRAKFEETERRRMEQNDELAEVRVRWIGTLIWGFTAVSAAFKIAGGVSKD